MKLSVSDKNINVIWFGPANEPSGYGVATRYYLKHLANKKDLQLRLVNQCFWGGDRLNLGDDRIFFEGLAENECLRGIPIVVVYHLIPDHYKILEGVDKHIGMTTFETDSLPRGWIIPMRAMDEIWTFTRFSKDNFKNSQIDRPIQIIPHGIDSDYLLRSKNKPLKYIKESTKEKYVFGSIFDWHSRKNPESLIEGFLRSFSGKEKDNVCLVLKTFYTWKKDGDAFIEHEVGKIREKVGNIKDQPKIHLLTDIISSDDMPRFYRSIDCYVSTSRGEGWNLPASEAMTMGIPVVVTGWGGHTDFINEDCGYLIDYKIVPVKEEDAKYHPYFKYQNWAEINIDDFIDKLRNVYFNRRESIEVGKKAQKYMIENFKWDIAGKKLYNNIKRIVNE